MSTSLLYHAFAIRGYDYVKTDYAEGAVTFTICQSPQDWRCAACGGRQVIGSVTAQRKTWDFVRHIRDVVESFPQATKFHWVMDNLNTHWTWPLCQYLGRLSNVWEDRPSLRTGAARRAFLTNPSHKHVVHFTPKHGSWMNQIEIWFGVLSRQLLRRGEFHSVAELTERINEFIAYYNRHLAFPYEWTYTGKPMVSKPKTQRSRFRYRRRHLVTMRPG